jgi:hypothetical protein
MMMRLMASAEAGIAAEEDPMLDSWIHTSLSIAFDTVLVEPIPDEILVILSANVDT